MPLANSISSTDEVSTDRLIDHAGARPCAQERREHIPIILLGQRGVDEPDLPLVEEMTVAVIRRDDDELGAVEDDVPLDQRQGAFADRAEADHHDRPVEIGHAGASFPCGG